MIIVGEHDELQSGGHSRITRFDKAAIIDQALEDVTGLDLLADRNTATIDLGEACDLKDDRLSAGNIMDRVTGVFQPRRSAESDDFFITERYERSAWQE